MRDTLQRNLRTFMEPDIQEWARTFNTAILNDARMKDTQFVAQVIHGSKENKLRIKGKT